MFTKNQIKSKNKLGYSRLVSLVIGIYFLLFGVCSNAQCAMCRAVLESEEGGTQAEAVNDGIVYLMAFPYILVAIVGYVVYRIKFKPKSENKEAS